MAKPQKVTRNGRTLYRVQIRRKTRGIRIDEYFRTAREAARFIREVENRIADGKPIAENTPGRDTFAQAVDAYLTDAKALTSNRGNLKPSTLKDRRERLLWLSRLFGDVYLKRLTWEHIDNKLSAEATKNEWSTSTRYRYESTLSKFLDYCRTKHWVTLNVIDGQERNNFTKRRHRTYTDDEWQLLLDAADDMGGMLPMFLRLAWETGARKSELLKLRWVDIEPGGNKDLGAALALLDTKTHQDRRVFTSKDAHRLLLAHEQQYRLPSSPLVFPSRSRNGMYSVDQPFRDARAAAGLDEPDEKYGEILTIHHIRHTWATRLGDRGASLAQLMAAGGWTTPATAMRYMKTQSHQASEAAILLQETKR